MLQAKFQKERLVLEGSLSMPDAVDELIDYYLEFNLNEFRKAVHEDFNLTYEQASQVYFLIQDKHFNITRQLLKHWLEKRGMP